MSKLKVTVPATESSSYDIHIGTGQLCELWQQLEKDHPSLAKFVVTDANVANAGHLKTLIGESNVDTFVIDPPGEVSKHIDTVVSIIEQMEKGFLGRDSLIVALGGGTVGDIAGFAAAIFKRGVQVVHIPTTTVSQADSSIGGKTGVDSSISKNAFGVFWQPAGVYVDVETLDTLDERQYRAGLVESVKHALIADAGYFEFIEENLSAILARSPGVLEKICRSNCTIKAAVVAEDPTEKNKRRILNYGHTIGHAVETASGFELLHGEAVSVGIVGAGLIEIELGLGSKKRLERIQKVLRKLDMPTGIPAEIDKKSLTDIIKRDKKAVNKWPRFVLLESIGKALCREQQWAHEVSRDLVEEILGKLC